MGGVESRRGEQGKAPPQRLLKELLMPNTISPNIISVLAFFLIIATVAPAWAAEADSIIGFWNTPDKAAQFEIYRCESFYCGKISSLREPNHPPSDGTMAGKPITDTNNPNPALRDRTLTGLPLISGFCYEGDNSWKGLIYNPQDGNTYRCNFSMAGDNLLKVRGYIGIPLLGRTQVWTRATN